MEILRLLKGDGSGGSDTTKSGGSDGDDDGEDSAGLGWQDSTELEGEQVQEQEQMQDKSPKLCTSVHVQPSRVVRCT